MAEKKAGEALLPITHYRENRTRQSYMSRAATASKAIGALSKERGFFILTNGAFSMIDAVRHVLAETGPARVLVTTWVPGFQEVVDLSDLKSQGAVISLRFVVDRGFFSTRQAKAEEFMRLVGEADIRISSTHAKICTIRNERWDYVLRGSLNLNANKRAENLDGDNDAGLCDALEEFYNECPAYIAPSEARAGFEKILAPPAWEQRLAKRMKKIQPFL
jgi:hypothetical protein